MPSWRMRLTRSYSELRATLLATGDADILDHTASDEDWGGGGDAGGKNMLGQILMRIRSELKETDRRHAGP